MHCNIFKASSSDAVLLLECQVLRDKSVDLRMSTYYSSHVFFKYPVRGNYGPVLTHPINHALDQLDLAVAKPVLVGNVIGDS